ELVVADLESRARRLLSRVLDAGDLALSEIVQLLRLGRVVAVTVDDHDASLMANRARPTLIKRLAGAPPGRKIPLAPAQTGNMVCPPRNCVPGEFPMADLPPLKQIIKAFESGQPAFTTFAPAEIEPAVALAQSKFDGVVYEMEHNFWDARMLRDALQYMLNRRQLASGGSLAPAVTPMVRIPPNGGEHNQWLAKQAPDPGAYGVLLPPLPPADHAYTSVA